MAVFRQWTINSENSMHLYTYSNIACDNISPISEDILTRIRIEEVYSDF
jgi:hypothetical protein